MRMVIIRNKIIKNKQVFHGRRGAMYLDATGFALNEAELLPDRCSVFGRMATNFADVFRLIE